MGGGSLIGWNRRPSYELPASCGADYYDYRCSHYTHYTGLRHSLSAMVLPGIAVRLSSPLSSLV
jgi:hypothetical protein